MTSRAQAEAGGGPHGSVFAANIPLGSMHIPKSHVEEGGLSTGLHHQSYARGIIDEASQYVKYAVSFICH